MKLLKLKLMSRQKTEVATPENNKRSLKRHGVMSRQEDDVTTSGDTSPRIQYQELMSRTRSRCRDILSDQLKPARAQIGVVTT